ncbi:hypothetical protein DPMN_186311 [Dreissena polymorpha]|uniref:Uncharacterized protein n=1 Tax=Dreissena polymorpha TaxID=45954 RepID=A0A9D4DLC4_DREPO|nr:hypothetical protein DPMN_186311 [Dreissena polymorpha]
MSMSELARQSPQLDIRYECRMPMSELDRHSPKLDILDYCRMSMSELARHSSFSIVRSDDMLCIGIKRTDPLQ